MVPSWLNIFHPQFFHLQFWDGTLLLMQDLAWGLLECQCVASSGAVFGAFWFFSPAWWNCPFSWQPEYISKFLNKMLYLSMPNASPSWHRECAAYGRTGTSQCPDIISLGQTEAPNSLDLPAYGRTETPTSPDLPAYGRTETSNSPDLTAYGQTETSNSPDLPAYGRTVRQT